MLLNQKQLTHIIFYEGDIQKKMISKQKNSLFEFTDAIKY